MKHYYFIIILALLSFASCAKIIENEDVVMEDEYQGSYSEMEALEDFAEVLSMAVYKNEELRQYLKKEALKEFDKDYDVFYPFIKEEILPSGKCIKDILIENAEEEQIYRIEQRIPKITILIPDFSWISEDCFSVKSWDTISNKVAVGVDDRKQEHALYYNGHVIGKLPASVFPSFPVLIVKNNERINATKTKAGNIEYSFVDKNFDGRKPSTKGHREGYLNNNDYNQQVDLVSQTEDYIAEADLMKISPESIEAFKQFGTGTGNGVQRDYINYGMTPESKSGVLNLFERDLLYRFHLTPASLIKISDATNDPRMDTYWTGRDDRPDFNHFLSRLWGNGNYEFRFDFFQGSLDGKAHSLGNIVITARPGELMYVTRCFSTFDWNFWGNNWSSYSIKPEDIEVKWFYPGDHDIPLSLIKNSWNLATSSDNILINIQEIDSNVTITQTKTSSFKQSFSVKADYEIEKFGLGVSGSYGSERVEQASYSVTYTEGSDILCEDYEVQYIDNVIIAQESNFANGYQLKRHGNGNIGFSLIPIDIRKEAQIKQDLSKRTPMTK